MEEIFLGNTELNISNEIVEVSLWRNKNGNLVWRPTNMELFEKGGSLSQGTCIEGYNDEIIITKYQ